MTFFPGFAPFRIATSGAEIAGVTGGSGPPLLLLHGYPQSHVLWHRVAPLLQDAFTLVIADLRGYGASSKPPSAPDHAPHSKRAMAQDMVEVMAHLGHARFDICGHDRGGRVAHRLCLDHPETVRRWSVLDIAPTREMYRATDETFAHRYWHWFWLTLPAPQPERMIAADPQAFCRFKLGQGRAGLAPFSDAALAEYIAHMSDPATVHAMCEDYRAAASIDLAHDDADGDRKVAAPLLALWGGHGVIEECFDCLALWRRRVDTVSGAALEGGHYLPEECPRDVADRLRAFLLDG
ncbi:alpha/beta hydrolase [Thalassococcus sp. CAU 1522]|uniref:Alpha/beta hydrolase n=1 Tax=Thalassococcus arenae TaxID=2851652 RepID=A0ABS6N6Z7_9RHOB|nr:alpha/beta hydrolase [Thalassococcus arenae]MBV2359786.1 alpha/beta hydrolase [Thalassococcus arenae]